MRYEQFMNESCNIHPGEEKSIQLTSLSSHLCLNVRSLPLPRDAGLFALEVDAEFTSASLSFFFISRFTLQTVIQSPKRTALWSFWLVKQMHRSRSCIVSGQFIAMFSRMAKKVKISRNLILGQFHFFFHFCIRLLFKPKSQ